MATDAFILREDPKAVIDAIPRYEIGGTYRWKHRTLGWGFYRYQLFTSTAAVDTGDVCEFMDASGIAVGPDRDETGFIALCPAGVAIGTVVTTANYGFTQVGGVITVAARTDGAVAAGDYLVTHTADDEADTMADGEEEQVFGISCTTDGADGYAAAGGFIFKGLL